MCSNLHRVSTSRWWWMMYCKMSETQFQPVLFFKTCLWQFLTFRVSETCLWQDGLYRFIPRYISSLVWNCRPSQSLTHLKSERTHFLWSKYNNICASQGRRPNLPDIYCITQSDFCPAYNGGTVSCDHDVWPWTLMLGQWGYPDWLRFFKIATPTTSSLCASVLSGLMWPTSVWMVKLCHMCNIMCPGWEN